MSFFQRIISYGSMIAILLLTTVVPASASTNTYNAKFVTSMTYMNVGTRAANLSIKFIDESGTIINYPIMNSDGSARTLAPNASASLGVSVLRLSTTSWNSGAIISANQPLATTMVQVSSSRVIRVRPVSNGFSASDAHTTISLPYVAKACTSSSLTTRFNVQNIGPSTDDITINLFWPNGDTAFSQTFSSIAAGQIVAIDMGTISVINPTTTGYVIPSNCVFEGSARISTTGTSKVVATAFETSTTGRSAATYESLVSPGSNRIFMPSVLCNVNYGDGAQSSSIIVHNTGASAARITYTYSYQIRAANGTLGAITNKQVALPARSVRPNATLTINACTDVPSGAVGSAVVTTFNPALSVTALSRVTGPGVSALAPGIPLNYAAASVAAPYVRYSTRCFTASPKTAVCRNESRQRTLFSVQNTSTNTDIRVRMTLYNHLGVIVGTRFVSGVIKPGAKVSLSPINIAAINNTAITNVNNEFGYWVVGGNLVYGGSAIFESFNATTNAVSTIPIAVTIRVLNSTVVGQTAEDYNAIPR